MKRLYIYNILLALLFFPLSIKAQAQEFAISGSIYNQKEEPIFFATIFQKDGNRYVYSDDKGLYKIVLPKGKHTLVFSCMGYEERSIEIDLQKEVKGLNMVLKELSLSLNEVSVIAQSVENKEGTSVYEIGEQAIKQVQAMNLADVLKLLPGKKMVPVNLNSAQRPDLRTAASSTANNFGTSVIVDGAQINNDGNLQAANPALTANNSGIDLRAISASGIDKVEVISGVASPKYGDLTSGAIIVKSKVGRAPLMLSVNLTPVAYQFSGSKGFQLPKNGGFINTDISYTYSNASTVDHTSYYNSINAGLRWRKMISTPLEWSNTVSLQLNTSHNGQRDDPEEVYEVIRRDRSQRYTLNINGSLKFLGTTSYTLTGNIDNQYNFSHLEMNNGPFPLYSGLTEGTFFVPYSPIVYIQETLVKGLPISLSGRLESDQNISSGDYRFTFNTGVQYSFVKNMGKGRISTGDVVGVGGSLASRAAKFHEIPASVTYSAYHESNIRRITEKSRHELRLGGRYDFMNGRYHLFSPRLSYNGLFYKAVKLRASWGISYKAPAMIQLYPGPSYYDFVNHSHYTTNPLERLAVVTTHIYQPTNEHLKPSKGETKEVGLDWEGGQLRVRATYFHKRLSRGIYQSSELMVLDKQNYRVVDRPPNRMPIVEPIEGDIVKILKTVGVVKNSYTATTNGLEVVISPPKIESTNTAFDLRLSYMQTLEDDASFKLQLPTSMLGQELRYGVYENPRNMVKASSGNLTIIQHIPSLRLIFNLVVELNFLSYSYRIAPNLYPFAYYDNQGEYHAIPEENRTDPEYENLKLPESTYNYYPSPFYTNYHLQVRKETKSGHSFSFYANNCFWYNPIYIRNEVRSRLNSSISFGFGVAFRLFN